MFSLGGKRVKERLHYDHVGVKTCVEGDTHTRTDEKVSKARWVLNMSTNVGIIKGGLNLYTCNVIFWTVVVPTLLFGCETWFIKTKDIDMLSAFQRYAARRLQRLHFRSLNVTALMCLGWMHLLTMVKARKIIFLRTVCVMEEFMPVKAILCQRIDDFDPDCPNQYESVIIQILKYCREFGLLELVRVMARGGYVSKEGWKRTVWNKAWQIEQAQWDEIRGTNQYLDLVQLVTPKVSYSIWWMIADRMQHYMRRCELMVKLLSHASLLRGDDKRYKSAPFSSRCCTLCDHAAIEETKHMVMQCSGHDNIRELMYNEINQTYHEIDRLVTFGVLMGGFIEGWVFEEMIPIWQVSCTYISQMYYTVLKSRSSGATQ